MSADRNNDCIEPIGLLAGWGRYPIVVAEALRRRGHRVIGLGVRDHANPLLAELCDEFEWIGLGTIGRAIRRFRRSGVTRAVMAGKIHKVMFYRPGWWLRHCPDWTALQTFFGHFVSGAKDRKDDS